MPANILEGQDAEDVADVRRVGRGPRRERRADRPGEPAEADARPAEATDGKAIFASAGCGGCHTLAAAGSSGTVGPNLDEAKPSKQLAIDRVTNGRGGMPSFKGQLSEAQIEAVATFVSENAAEVKLPSAGSRSEPACSRSTTTCVTGTSKRTRACSTTPCSSQCERPGGCVETTISSAGNEPKRVLERLERIAVADLARGR